MSDSPSIPATSPAGSEADDPVVTTVTVPAKEDDDPVVVTTPGSSGGEAETGSQLVVPTIPATRDRRGRAQIQTVRLDSRDIRPSWPTAIATLEQLSGWAVLALRLGTLALIQQCVRELAEQDARAEVIDRLRALTDALAHMPLEA